MNILDKIVAYKREEVEKAKSLKSIAELEQLPLFEEPSFSLKRFLLDEKKTGIIAEFKRKSPSKGIINDKVKVSQITRAYASNGASGLSILTDEPSFGGSIDDMITARFNDVPILRKEFIIDEYQIVEAKAYGADVILLIAAILTPEQVHDFTLKAHELGLEVILEIHDDSELGHIQQRTDIVGVNNRNLKTFEVDIEQSIRLSHHIPENKIKISESGINSVQDILNLKSAGYNGFLIGENFMKQEDPGLAFMKFTSDLRDALV
ncbi:indole-3-glycerol phosphate synthase TrpC [Flavisolibacter tropicus]|uniref:Indole-3-glycerol phosphate synthase n=1 Tax=Flavisolibacter tropicus TaxID=1492898 RepID=A0A172TRX3_9BACT|nr:indole-3-glycerol phosphate synthase TrpC [Flavisolibacter tropicus]ANE49829.1 indole-3-glycerol phosphate synthase [Flavisolibacter tropicus]